MPDQDKIFSHCLALLENLSGLRSEGRCITKEHALCLLAPIWPLPEARLAAAKALSDSFLAVTMLWRTLGQGFRGNPLHPRPRDTNGPRLAADLLAVLRLHLKIRADLPALVAWPASGVAADSLEGDGGWCDLCGHCCCHAGTVSTPPAGVEYPSYFHHALAGETLFPQPYCPFLFQSLERPLFFCGLHPVKPLACRLFDEKDCHRGKKSRGFRPLPEP